VFSERRDAYGRALAQLLDAGLRSSGLDHARACAAGIRFAGALAVVFESVDLFLAPSGSWTLDLAHARRARGAADARGGPHDCLHRSVQRLEQPLALPAGGLDDRAAPFGFQLVARPLGEPQLVRAGHPIQQITGWHRAAPSGPGGL
jgi:amidase